MTTLTYTPTPRKPTEEELGELAIHLVERHHESYSSGDLNDVLMQLDATPIAVFENYITDCPGYAGKVMVVVWGSGPEYHEIYIWEKESEKGKKRLVNVRAAV